MTELIIFLLATTGLTFITNKSTIFKPLRTWVSENYIERVNKKLIDKEKFRLLFMWAWAEGILNCGMCMSVYTGTICALVIYFGYTIFLFPFCATTIVTLIFQYYDKTKLQ